ncbi:MAG: CYTH domain-containing protein [Methylotetracoccus sp.]
MAIEIERKFLVNGDSWKQEADPPAYLRQAYLTRDHDCSIRVRTDGQRAWMNIKGATVGVQRAEYEYEIPLADGIELVERFARGPVIEKWRYVIPAGRHHWEIDVFEGENSGLVVAEIELDDPADEFARPDWLGEEVTHDVRYYNTQLSLHPYRQWRSA